MKRIAFTILSLILFSSAAFNASAQGQSRDVSGFNAVASAGPFHVHIKINGTESVKVDVDQEYMNEVETIVENGTLKIRFKDRDHRSEHNLHRADIYVSAKSLSGLINSGSGEMNLEEGVVSGESVKVILSGSGNIKSEVKSERLESVVSGSGNINIKGSTNEANIVVTGSGEVSGRDLKTQSLDATITGSGNINVSADKSVKGRITGSGNIVYSGNATIVNSSHTGSGRVSKAD
jgi:hypothetical protein